MLRKEYFFDLTNALNISFFLQGLQTLQRTNSPLPSGEFRKNRYPYNIGLLNCKERMKIYNTSRAVGSVTPTSKQKSGRNVERVITSQERCSWYKAAVVSGPSPLQGQHVVGVLLAAARRARRKIFRFLRIY